MVCESEMTIEVLNRNFPNRSKTTVIKLNSKTLNEEAMNVSLKLMNLTENLSKIINVD